MPEEFEILDSAIDLADPRDYPHEEVFGSIEELPERVFHALAPIYNQEKTMRCTIFSAAKGANENNGLEQAKYGVPFSEITTPLALLPYCGKYGFSEATGGPISGPLDALRIDLGILDGRTTVGREISQIKQAIVKASLCCGSKSINWPGLKLTNFIVEAIASGAAHAFCIVGYDDNFITKFGKGAFICANSYSAAYGRDGGYFYIPYELANGLLFSIHFPVDHSNASPLLRYRAKIKGIWNGERENESITRYEASEMAQRVNRSYTGYIWNQKDCDLPIIRQDFVAMVSRVTEKEISWS